jgi:flagellin-like hook-associated protein FlgL
LLIAPNSSQLDLQGFNNFNGQNIDLTVDSPTGVVNSVNYGSNNFNNFIGVTKNTSLTFTGGELSRGGYVQIGNTKITLPTFNPATSNDVKYWNDLVAGTIKTALDNSTEFDGYFFKQVDNNLLVFAAGDRESFDFDIVNSSDSQIKMAIDEPEQNLMTTSSTLRPEQFLTNIEGLERVTRSSGKSLSSIDLLNGNSARESISTIDVAIDIISSSRAQMGAFLNRLESVSVNLSEYLLNTTNSRSRILDTDYAQETVALAKNQIISQSALAMLAQANQSAQTVLALLKT